MSLDEMTRVDFKIAEAVHLGLDDIFVYMDRESAMNFFKGQYDLFDVMTPGHGVNVWRLHLTIKCIDKYRRIIAALPKHWFAIRSIRFDRYHPQQQPRSNENEYKF